LKVSALENATAKKRRVKIIIERLRAAYPDAHCSLNYSTPLELLAATILSAQCTDERVNRVTETLFRKYRSAADFAAADIAELEQDVRPTGFFRNKAKSLQGMGEAIVQRFDGEVPRTMQELLTLPGVARKTANVVLGNAFGDAPGVVVDTHVTRLAARLGLSHAPTAEKIERDLMPLVPRNEYVMFPHLMICHGRAVCKARTPQCAECVLRDVCPQAQAEEGGTERAPARGRRRV
jgi:endonuclease-3